MTSLRRSGMECRRFESLWRELLQGWIFMVAMPQMKALSLLFVAGLIPTVLRLTGGIVTTFTGANNNINFFLKKWSVLVYP